MKLDLTSPFERIGERAWIALGDCLEIMNDIPEGSIDLVLCDLPYGTTDYEWDSCLDHEMLFDSYRRLLAPTGTILLFGSEPFSTELRNMAKDLYKYDLVWIKDSCTGFQHAKNMPLKNYELISVFSKGSMGHESRLGNRRMTYNPQGIIPCGKIVNGKKGSGLIASKCLNHSVVTQEYSNYPKMAQRWHSDRGDHPTQKPIALLEYLILTYSNGGGVGPR